jgi:hypothetical protein
MGWNTPDTAGSFSDTSMVEKTRAASAMHPQPRAKSRFKLSPPVCDDFNRIIIGGMEGNCKGVGKWRGKSGRYAEVFDRQVENF